MVAEVGEFRRFRSLNIVVGECNDSFLNDMRGLHVRPEHGLEAIACALVSDGSVQEGSVGTGAGMRCFGWKGGIGTSSRQVRTCDGQPGYHVGVLVLTNFGVPGDLTILGCPVGQALSSAGEGTRVMVDGSANRVVSPSELSDGSVIIVVATDLPVDVQQLGRLAKRSTFGLARVGSIAHHGSGDIVIAFRTNGANLNPDHERTREWLRDGSNLSDCFRAVVEATEEAILNSLWAADTTMGRRSRVVRALPVHEVEALLSGTLDSGLHGVNGNSQ